MQYSGGCIYYNTVPGMSEDVIGVVVRNCCTRKSACVLAFVQHDWNDSPDYYCCSSWLLLNAGLKAAAESACFDRRQGRRACLKVAAVL